MIKKYNEVHASRKHIYMSIHKVRRILDQIRGSSYENILMILELIPYRASFTILKLLNSAASNANHNMGFNMQNLVILKAEVNTGSNSKKLKPRAKGRSNFIKRSTCHINIILNKQ
uniref:Large ribosomal subunit protein uL22c n=1 Tax=Cytinus hypocistis TaxID=327100 RepID=A0A1B0VBG7_9ROSI|nr:ribosomal protein L22 [Cytinus hypocistis]AMR36143.1 ribosomal protein L22 [Cytinus hypocistis]